MPGGGGGGGMNCPLLLRTVNDVGAVGSVYRMLPAPSATLPAAAVLLVRVDT